MEYNGHRYVYAAASEGESEVLCCVYLSGFDEGGRATGSNESKEEGRREEDIVFISASSRDKPTYAFV